MIDKKFSQSDAETIMQLLHGLSEEQINSPETYDALINYLRHKRLAIRELAYMRLWLLVPPLTGLRSLAAAMLRRAHALLGRCLRFPRRDGYRGGADAVGGSIRAADRRS